MKLALEPESKPGRRFEAASVGGLFAFSFHTIRFVEGRDMIDKQGLPQQIGREEPAPTRNEFTTII